MAAAQKLWKDPRLMLQMSCNPISPTTISPCIVITKSLCGQHGGAAEHLSISNLMSVKPLNLLSRGQQVVRRSKRVQAEINCSCVSDFKTPRVCCQENLRRIPFTIYQIKAGDDFYRAGTMRPVVPCGKEQSSSLTVCLRAAIKSLCIQYNHNVANWDQFLGGFSH